MWLKVRSKSQISIHQSGCISKKRLGTNLKLVHHGQNADVKEIRNLIGCLEDWEPEKTDISLKFKTPD